MNTVRLGAAIVVLAALGGLAALFLSTHRVEALPAYIHLFEQQYQYRPSCVICHVGGGDSQKTDYGRDFLQAGADLKAFERIAQKDSDDDGILNLDEVQVRSNPGDSRSTPNNPGDWLSKVEQKALPLKELKQLFPGIEKFSWVEGKLPDEEIRSVEKALGKPLLDEDRVPTFYFPMKEIDGKLKRIGVASFVTQCGPNGDLMLAVAVNTKSAVTKVFLLKHKEAKALAEETFLKQFVGKTYRDAFKVGEDVTPIPGEEAASQAVATGIRKYLLITRAAFARKKG